MMLVRSALGALGASALVAASMSPAAAGGNDRDNHDDDNELRVVVCVLVDNDDDDEEFDVDVWTDEERDDATLGDRECERFTLDFDDNVLYVEEDVDTDDWDVTFKVYGDDEDSWSRDGKLKVEFDDDADDPRLGILIKNEEADNGDDDHHNGYRHHDYDNDRHDGYRHHDGYKRHHDDDDGHHRHHHDSYRS